jgi:hypothetical protein
MQSAKVGYSIDDTGENEDLLVIIDGSRDRPKRA